MNLKSLEGSAETVAILLMVKLVDTTLQLGLLTSIASCIIHMNMGQLLMNCRTRSLEMSHQIVLLRSTELLRM